MISSFKMISFWLTACFLLANGAQDLTVGIVFTVEDASLVESVNATLLDAFSTEQHEIFSEFSPRISTLETKVI